MIPWPFFFLEAKGLRDLKAKGLRVLKEKPWC